MDSWDRLKFFVVSFFRRGLEEVLISFLIIATFELSINIIQ